MSQYEKDATLKIHQARTATKIRFGGHFDVTRKMLTSNIAHEYFNMNNVHIKLLNGVQKLHLNIFATFSGKFICVDWFSSYA
jgi:hypothetical protein